MTEKAHKPTPEELDDLFRPEDPEEKKPPRRPARPAYTPRPMMAPLMPSMAAPAALPIARKTMEIPIGDGRRVTVYEDDFLKELSRDLFRQVGLSQSLLKGGS